MALQSLVQNRAISSNYLIPQNNHYFSNRRLACYRCRTRGQENDVIYNLSFVLNKKDKILVKIFKPKFICIKCAIEEWLQKFNYLEIEGLIRIKRKRFNLKDKKRKRVYISFKKYFKVIKMHPEKCGEINKILCDMGILLFEKDGNKPISIEDEHNTYYVSRRCIPSYRSAIEQIRRQ